MATRQDPYQPFLLWLYQPVGTWGPDRWMLAPARCHQPKLWRSVEGSVRLPLRYQASTMQGLRLSGRNSILSHLLPCRCQLPHAGTGRCTSPFPQERGEEEGGREEGSYVDQDALIRAHLRCSHGREAFSRAKPGDSVVLELLPSSSRGAQRAPSVAGISGQHLGRVFSSGPSQSAVFFRSMATSCTAKSTNLRGSQSTKADIARSSRHSSSFCLVPYIVFDLV